MSKRTFKKITIIGLKSLLSETRKQIESHADKIESTVERPETVEALINTIGDSDAILISAHVKLTKEIFDTCTQLQYVGVYAKSLGCIDLNAAKNAHVTVTNFTETSDWETAEFCISVMLEICRGLSPLEFSKIPISLKKKNLGIIGFGKIGQNVARMAVSHGMNVAYYSRTRKKELETESIVYKSQDELLLQSDIISLHGPSHKIVLSKNDFQNMNHCTLLINTCLGEVVNQAGFNDWIETDGHFAMFDEVAALENDYLATMKNVYLPARPAWRTLEAIQNKDRQLLNNLIDYLAN